MVVTLREFTMGNGFVWIGLSEVSLLALLFLPMRRMRRMQPPQDFCRPIGPLHSLLYNSASALAREGLII